MGGGASKRSLEEAHAEVARSGPEPARLGDKDSKVTPSNETPYNLHQARENERIPSEDKELVERTVQRDVKEQYHSSKNQTLEEQLRQRLHQQNQQQNEDVVDDEYEMLRRAGEDEEEEEIRALIASARFTQNDCYSRVRVGMERDGEVSDDDNGEDIGLSYGKSGGHADRGRYRANEGEGEGEDDDQVEFAFDEEEEEDYANNNQENRENWQMLTNSLEMDNEELLFNMLYFSEDAGVGVGVGAGMSSIGSVINSALTEAVALHSENNTPYKLKPASLHDLQSLEPETLSSAESEKMRAHGDGGILECAVCMEELNLGVKILKLPACHHCFHAECLFSWFRHQNWCPTCRTPINGIVRSVAPDSVTPRSSKEKSASVTAAASPRSEPHPAKLSAGGIVSPRARSIVSVSTGVVVGVSDTDDRAE